MPISAGRILKRASREPPKWLFRRLNGDEGAIHGGIPMVARIPLRAARPTIFGSGAWGSLRIASGRWPRVLGVFQDEGAAVSEMGGDGSGAHAKGRRVCGERCWEGAWGAGG